MYNNYVCIIYSIALFFPIVLVFFNYSKRTASVRPSSAEKGWKKYIIISKTDGLEEVCKCTGILKYFLCDRSYEFNKNGRLDHVH